ncbi:hypothetical protein DFR50_12530 [Roseiarcus fermentans]|uniref:Uncharacterized protein n=1 Tax=Roseiarcus fermentans TaxID=1473586 RepID=A0A366F1K6_9HYPH|nr:hypothetical protein [Roseiarcus fermentans]RBP08548.1 hypothetical protein DFR50_12530 [Roseiarcus fermentans]
MHIHLIGGSNAGIWDGWAHHFVILAERDLGARMTNGFLGAVGSLFGLFRLDRLESEGGRLPDVVVFEYALNDIVLAHGRVVSIRLVRDTLTDVAGLCVRAGIALQFLCLEPRDLRGRAVSRRVTAIYCDVARAFALPAPLFQRDAMEREIGDGDYLDLHHLTPDASRTVAEALARRLALGLRKGAAPPGPPPGRALAFVDATRARPSGRAFASTCATAVLSGPVVEMRRPSAAVFPADGRLVGVLFRARRSSGWYRIAVGGESRRKNACESALAILPEVISMQVPRLSRPARGSVEIAMPDDEGALMRLACDRSPMPWEPRPPFDGQDLALFGIVLWRETGPLARLREAVRAAGVAVSGRWRRYVIGSAVEPRAPAPRLRYRRGLGRRRSREAAMARLGSATERAS